MRTNHTHSNRQPYSRVIHTSMGEFLDYVSSLSRQTGGDRLKPLFFGASSVAGAVRYIHNGATEYETRETRTLLDKIESGFHGRTVQQWQPSVMGAYPMVPDFLAGMPDCMRRRMQTDTDVSPIRIVVNTTVSAGVDAHDLARRGAAATALAIKLSEVRPVELWAAYGGHAAGRTTIGRVKMDTNPVSISNAVAVLSSRQFARAICFAPMIEAANYNTSIGWPQGIRGDAMREALDLEPQDIYIPGGHISEADKFGGDVVAWIESYLKDQREVDA